MANGKIPRWRRSWTKFSAYESKGWDWITVAPARFYPDYLADATVRYAAAVERFGDLLNGCDTSAGVYHAIMALADAETKKQLFRIFRRYISPTSPVELLKRKGRVDKTAEDFGEAFRDINEVREAFTARPARDEALSAILWEHQERGKRGADLTEQFFQWVGSAFPSVKIRGGRDIPLATILPGYPKSHGVDFVMTQKKEILAIGFLHYDSDRGGSQEADRTGQYGEAAEEIVPYLQRQGNSAKLIYVNDGPGLLAGKMWRKYSELEERWPHKILVSTLKMLDSRLTLEWLRS